MQMINSTWPHPDHLLINNGVPGSSFRSFAQGSCLEPLLPASPDLLILEHLPYLEGDGSPGLHLEMLINRLQHNFNRTLFPAMVFINMHRALDYPHNSPRFSQAALCINDDRLCPQECPTIFLGLPAKNSSSTAPEVATNHAASHYGTTSLSYANLISSIVYTNKPRLMECQLFSQLFCDSIHPRPGTGTLLLTDLLTNQLFHAHAHFKAHPQAPPIPWGQRKAPLDPNSLLVPQMRCFGSNVVALTHLNDEQVGSYGLDVAQPINVVRADGWAYFEVDGGKAKPGWIATRPGSLLWMSVDTDFGAPNATKSIALIYLLSHQHMGRAEVSCVDGCDCTKTVLDAHDAKDHHSVPTLHDFPISTRDAPGRSLCVMQLEVLGESSSGENKFKVMQLVVKTWVKVPHTV